MVSLSARRAWIEISIICCEVVTPIVALRKESVDRNGGKSKYCIVSAVALRKESVDRNSLRWLYDNP